MAVHRHEILVFACHERKRPFGSLVDVFQTFDIAQFDNQAVESILPGRLGQQPQGSLVGYVLLVAQSPDTHDDLLGLGKAIQDKPLRLRQSRLGQGLEHDAFALLAFGQRMPDFLGDERHERMQCLHQDLHETDRPILRHPVYRLAVSRLDHFQVPGAEIIPYQFI